jgi:hypothetical protein
MGVAALVAALAREGLGATHLPAGVAALGPFSPAGAAPGARVGLAEVEPMAPAGANAVKKKKHMEKAAAGLRTADTVATCDGVPLSVEGSPCVSLSVPAGTIS